MKSFLLLLFITCMSTFANSQAINKNDDIPYNLNTVTGKWTLPADLNEISGATWIDQDHLLVIEDIHACLYLIKLTGDKATIEKKVFFSKKKADKKFDIEDVTMVGNTVYALYSHGKIFKINDWSGQPAVKEIPTFLSKENNTEGACYDKSTNSLLVACKNNSGIEDEKKSVKAIYRFDLNADSMLHEPFMMIHKKDFKQKGGDNIKFFPSAIAIHPLSGDIYILSTKDTKCLAIYSHAGQLKSFHVLSIPGLSQPEGICFSPAGVLYISTEARHGMPAAIYSFQIRIK